jgi:hypothetical protein
VETERYDVGIRLISALSEFNRAIPLTSTISFTAIALIWNTEGVDEDASSGNELGRSGYR